jgi:hypothetical protein
VKEQPIRKDDFRDCFATGAGKRVLSQLRRMFMGESYVKGESDRDMAFREGRRAVMMFIDRKIEQGNDIPEKEIENA